MKKMFVLGMAAAALAIATAAYAYPTLTGPTGGATLPNAAVVPAGQLQLAADWVNTDPDAAFPIRATYGLGSNFELGAAYIVQSDANTWDINAKYATALKVLDFSWALGAQYLTSNDTDMKATQVYFVGSRPFDLSGMTLNGTVGVNWTKISDGIDEDAIRLFGGLDTTFANGLNLGAELQSKNEDIESDMMWSVVARYPFTPNLAGQVGITNGPIFGSGDSNVFVGATYAFGAAAATEE